jgi:inner membrane protein
MESITHIVLGATLGEVMAGKKLGKKAMLLGAIAQSLPDFDFIAGLWMSPAHYFLAHRGLTHSFLFITLAALLLAILANSFYKKEIPYKHWALFFFAQMLTHVLLDSLNAYGIAWLEPFSHQRFSFDVLFVADPFYTVWPLVACVVLLILKTSSPSRMKWAITALVLSSFYILYAFSNKMKADQSVRKSLADRGIEVNEFLTTPTPLNSWLWYVVVPASQESTRGYWIGYYSVFDAEPSIRYQFFTQNDSLLSLVNNHEDVELLIRLSRDYYVVEQKNDSLVFSNLRFGQMNGWDYPQSPFVFQYFLDRENSLFAVQRGRFSDWDADKVNHFLKRIRGH